MLKLEIQVFEIQNLMEKQSLVQNYERRLKQLPQQDKQLLTEIKKYEDLVSDQQLQLNQHNVKIKTLESELIKLQKVMQQRQNEIQQLSESQQKNAVKQKKYFMQIENYNKKIENYKEEIAKTQKSIALQKKQTKNIQSTISAVTSQSKKVISALTKSQIKINTLNQTLNDLKMKLMEQHTSKNSQNIDDLTKKDEKMISQLFNAIKKQLALIDILKRQKVHVVASTVFKYCEEEFQKVLEMNQQK